MSVLVYRYGLRPPVVNAEFVREQMKRAHDYRNHLTAIARGERAAKRAAIETVTEVQVATTVAEEATRLLGIAIDAVKREHIDAKKRVHGRDAAEALVVARVTWLTSLKTLDQERRRASRLPAVRAEFERLENLAHELRISARHHQSPWWGTYLLVEAASEQSLRLVLAPGKMISLPLWDGLHTRDPHFVRFSEASRVVGACNNKGPLAGSDWFVTITENVNGPKGPTPPSAARSELYRMLNVQIGTQGRKREPVWASWHMVMDRPLPLDAKISGVKVICVREGPSERWEAHITLSTEIRRENCGTGRIALDIGYRRMEDGSLRVASWFDHQGRTGELRLDPAMLSSLTKAASLHGIRDDLFNRARLALAWWMGSVENPPEWMPRPQDLFAWRTPENLLRLCFTWREKRFSGDEEVYALLDGWVPNYTKPPRRGDPNYVAHGLRKREESWRRQDRHLAEWEAAQRSKSLARRKDFYRVFAAKLAREYGEFVMEDFDLRQVAERPAPEADEDAGTIAARAQRQLAALSELRGAIQHAFETRGGKKIVVDCTDSTHECPTCGAYTEFDARTKLWWTCSGCGKVWDQDESAARIHYARSERLGLVSGTGTARSDVTPQKKAGKWSRRKEDKTARAARKTLEGDRSQTTRDDGE